MFPVGGVEGYGEGFDEDVGVSEVRFGAVGDELGLSGRFDLDCSLCGHGLWWVFLWWFVWVFLMLLLLVLSDAGSLQHRAKE